MTPDYDSLDPGILATVRWLQERGFDTTDSGDGVTKLVEGHPLRDESWDFPHVVMAGDESEANRLLTTLAAAGVELSPGCIQNTYDPADGSQIIMLMNVYLLNDGWKWTDPTAEFGILDS